MNKIKRIKKLQELYDTTDNDELMRLMADDVRMIAKRQRREDERELKADTFYSRIGSDRWNR